MVDEVTVCLQKLGYENRKEQQFEISIFQQVFLQQAF